jgi:hypothetical protein
MGTRDKKVLVRQQFVAHSFKSVELAPLRVEALTPLAVMRIVMAVRIERVSRAGLIVGE